MDNGKTYRGYQAAIVAMIGDNAADPRHIEAWMRNEHGALDALSPIMFKHEIMVALECTVADRALSESLAQSMGI